MPHLDRPLGKLFVTQLSSLVIITSPLLSRLAITLPDQTSSLTAAPLAPRDLGL